MMFTPECPVSLNIRELPTPWGRPVHRLRLRHLPCHGLRCSPVTAIWWTMHQAADRVGDRRRGRNPQRAVGRVQIVRAQCAQLFPAQGRVISQGEHDPVVNPLK